MDEKQTGSPKPETYTFGNDFLTRAKETFADPYVSTLIEMMEWLDKERGEKYKVLKVYSVISTMVFSIIIVILTILLR